MDFTLLLKILLEWSFESKEYEMTNYIYNEFNIGIPVSFLYKLTNKSYFTSIDNFLSSSNTKKSENKDFDNLLYSFSKSKYGYLTEWNKYGYKL